MRKVTCHIPPSVRLLVVGTVLVLSVSSCKTSRKLNEAEQVVQTAPDSAAALLSGIDSTHLFFPSLKARYRLVNAIVMDKKHLAEDGSYLGAMRWISDYYQVLGSSRHRMLAYYYYADQLYDSGNKNAAMIIARQALELAHQEDDPFYSAMASRKISEIYQENYNTVAAIQFAEQALNSFQAGNFDLHVDYQYLDLANLYKSIARNKEAYEKADSLYSLAAFAARKRNDTFLLVESLKGKAGIYSELPCLQPDSVITLLTSVANTYHAALSARDRARLAWAYHQKGIESAAEACLSSAYSVCRTPLDSLSPLRFEYWMRKEPGNQAIELLEEALTIQNVEITHLLEQSVSEAQVNYLDQEKRRLSAKIQGIILATILITCVLAMLIVFLTGIVKRHKKSLLEKQLLLDERQSLLDELMEKMTVILDRPTPATYMEQNLFDTLCSEVYLPGTDRRDRVFQVVTALMEKYHSDPAVETAVSNYVNLTHNRLLARMQEQVPHWSADNQRIVGLLVAGFSYSAVSVLTGLEKPVLYNRITRLKNKISKSDIPDKEEFLSVLPNRSPIPQQ